MKKRNIVKKKEDFNRIINNKNKKISRYFVMNYENNNLNYSRYGISVGTKIGNAVTRNKYKRKIRMIINENKNLDNLKKDFIIIFRKGGLNKKYNELREDFNMLIKKLNNKEN